MRSYLKNGVLTIVMMALSTAAFSKPTHFVGHVGKGVVYPARHPKKSSHGVWVMVKEAF